MWHRPPRRRPRCAFCSLKTTDAWPMACRHPARQRPCRRRRRRWRLGRRRAFDRALRPRHPRPEPAGNGRARRAAHHARRASTSGGADPVGARHSLDDRVKGLDLGADDYMVKPFDVSELEARVRTLAAPPRRAEGLHRLLRRGRLSTSTRAAFPPAARRIDIPARELGLLETLFMRAGKVVAKQAIIESLAGFDEDLSANAIEQYVSRLRKRLCALRPDGADGARHRLLSRKGGPAPDGANRPYSAAQPAAGLASGRRWSSSA